VARKNQSPSDIFMPIKIAIGNILRINTSTICSFHGNDSAPLLPYSIASYMPSKQLNTMDAIYARIIINYISSYKNKIRSS
jgi:hypothetical protein